MESWGGYVILFLAGCLAGTINVIAGGGSFLTLPILIFLGLPATVANATNRVGILAQNVGAAWGFHRRRVLEWRLLPWTALPATAGAVLGVWGALTIPEIAFKRVLAFLMVALTLWTLTDPLKRIRVTTATDKARRGLLAAGFFVIGVYGGFIQAGVGFLILAVLSLAHLDLVRGNALKVAAALAFTALSLGVFWWEGKIAWPQGVSLAAGTLLGSQIGVHLTVERGHAWVKKVVTVMVILFAVKLWFAP